MELAGRHVTVGQRQPTQSIMHCNGQHAAHLVSASTPHTPSASWCKAKQTKQRTRGVVEARRRLDLERHLLAVIDAAPASPLIPQLNARRLRIGASSQEVQWSVSARGLRSAVCISFKCVRFRCQT